MGFRNPCFNDLDPFTSEIIVGDSFVYGVGLEDQSTFGCRLLAEGVSTYTLGIPGISPDMYLKLLKLHSNKIISKFPNARNINLVLFLGNDFEKLLNIKQNTVELSNPESAEPSKTRQWLDAINYVVTTNLVINQLYSVASIKLLVKPYLKSADHQSYVKNYAGSTFYKYSAKKPVGHIKNAITFIDSEIFSLGLKLSRIFLIKDPAALSTTRLHRDMLIARFSAVEEINVNFKIDAILAACSELGIRCFDTSSVLSANNYYLQDNHLNQTGSHKLSSYLAMIMKSDD